MFVGIETRCFCFLVFGRTWLERAEITQPCSGLQSRSKSRLQLSGGLSFASVVTWGQLQNAYQLRGGDQAGWKRILSVTHR